MHIVTVAVIVIAVLPTVVTITRTILGYEPRYDKLNGVKDG